MAATYDLNDDGVLDIATGDGNDNTASVLIADTESGLAARLGHPSEMKKAELVRKLAGQFQRVHDLSNPAGDDLKAHDWLPDAMRFPAVDPDAPNAVSDSPEDDPSEEAEDEAAYDAIAA